MATVPTEDRDRLVARAGEVVRRCRALATCSEEPGVTTRGFLSAPMHDVHARLTGWMVEVGMRVEVDAVGNLRGTFPAASAASRRLIIGSHLDTVPRAGAFDGVLGVVLGVALVEGLGRRPLPYGIEVVGFSDEEGVRFGIPFIGSRALVGTLDDTVLESTDARGRSVRDAIREYGLDPARLREGQVTDRPIGYVELHIEQGPVLDTLGVPLGIVDVITGQSRADVTFIGAARHAGTTPMLARRDAVASAAEWIVGVEGHAQSIPGLVATVGQVEVSPHATNVIAGACRCSLDVRHGSDDTRAAAVASMRQLAHAIAARRGLDLDWRTRLDQPATPMDPALVAALVSAVEHSGFTAHVMPSGGGHDAMIVARHMPAAMLFVRSPGGISHHADESVREDDVAAALLVGRRLLDELAERHHG